MYHSYPIGNRRRVDPHNVSEVVPRNLFLHLRQLPIVLLQLEGGRVLGVKLDPKPFLIPAVVAKF